jgi:short chain dehydrogenase
MYYNVSIENHSDSSMKAFTGKVVLVTGGTSGIGRATAVAFAQEEASVVVVGQRESKNTRKNMRRFTLFTLLYLAAGVCITAIAFQHPDMTPNAKTSLLVAAGLLYLCAIFTTFPFWHQFAQRSQERLRDKPAWQRNFVAIAPWLTIAACFLPVLQVNSIEDRYGH